MLDWNKLKKIEEILDAQGTMTDNKDVIFDKGDCYYLLTLIKKGEKNESSKI